VMYPRLWKAKAEPMVQEQSDALIVVMKLDLH